MIRQPADTRPDAGRPFSSPRTFLEPLFPAAVKFREISSADVPALFHVRTRTRENTYTLEQLADLGITAESVAEKLATSFKGWLCVDADQAVAFCMANRSTGELWVVAVLPEYEGRGIGNRLMSLAEDWLATCGCARAWLTTDIDTSLRAYGFYRHRGWTEWKVENGLRWMELVLSKPRVQQGSQLEPKQRL